MGRKWLIGLVLGLLGAAPAHAQNPTARFQWQAGWQLNYKVEQVTVAEETVEGKKSETKSRLTEVKSWKVTDVDAGGTAILEMTLTSLRLETTSPAGEVRVYDSAKPDQNNKDMEKALGQYVGNKLAVLRVDNRGKVVEVKESKNGSAARYESSPPFALVLPESGLTDNWERNYQVTVEPPQGTGEKYNAVQKYAVQKREGKVAVIGLTTTLKTQPEAAADRVPLLETQPEGEIYFDTEVGFLRSARLRVVKEIQNHQGAGSSYRFQSTYREDYAGTGQNSQ